MIVADASAVLDLVLRTPDGSFAAGPLLEDHAEVHAPAILDLEVAAVLRRWELAGRLPRRHAETALSFYGDQRITLHPPRALLARAWALRANLTIADGLYAALAEALDASLLTTDERMARALRKHTRLEVLAP